GPGSLWGQQHTWTNNAGYAPRGLAGSGVVVGQLPSLVALNGTTTLAALTGGTNARYFDNSSGYQERLALPEHLSSGSGQYTLTDSTGAQVTFGDFSSFTPLYQRGQLKSYADAYGHLTNVVSWTSSGRPQELQRTLVSGSDNITESYLLSYVTSGVNAGLVQSETLR